MRLLILVDNYYPTPTIIGVLLHNVASELVSRGHMVDILTVANSSHDYLCEKDGVRIFRIEADPRLKLQMYAKGHEGDLMGRIAKMAAGFVSKTLKLIHVKQFPLASTSLALRMSQAAMKLHEEESYDLVVASYWPAECAQAAVLIKNIDPKLRCVLFEMDHYPPIAIERLPAKTQEYVLRNWVNNVYAQFDSVLRLPGNEQWFNRPDVKSLSNRIEVIGIPLLKEVDNINSDNVRFYDSKFEGDWIYTGSLDNGLYNPVPVVETFLRMSQRGLSKLVFVGSSNADDSMRRYCSECEVKTSGLISLHGFMPHDELIEVMRKAKVLISIKSANRISGKIFEYMGMKKPIIHFSGCEDDPDVAYLEKYPLSLIVRTYRGTPDDWAAQIDRELPEVLNKNIDEIDFSGLYQFTPACSADVLERIASNRRTDKGEL